MAQIPTTSAYHCCDTGRSIDSGAAQYTSGLVKYPNENGMSKQADALYATRKQIICPADTADKVAALAVIPAFWPHVISATCPVRVLHSTCSCLHSVPSWYPPQQVRMDKFAAGKFILICQPCFLPQLDSWYQAWGIRSNKDAHRTDVHSMVRSRSAATRPLMMSQRFTS